MIIGRPGRPDLPRRAGAAGAGRDHGHPGDHHPARASAASRSPTRSPSAWSGLHGMAYANYAVHECDLIVAIGMRFDDRVTGKVEEFAPKAKVVHIDIDPAEIGKNVRVTVPIVGDVKNVLPEAEPGGPGRRATRSGSTRSAPGGSSTPPPRCRASDTLLPQLPIKAIYEVDRAARPSSWPTSASTRCGRPSSTGSTSRSSFITSGGMGTMGFSLPAAIGVKMARPEKEVWVVVGDGSLQMNMQELATAGPGEEWRSRSP